MDGMAWCRLGFPCRPSKTTYVDYRCNYYCGLPTYLTLEPSYTAVETRPLTPCFDRSRAGQRRHASRPLRAIPSLCYTTTDIQHWKPLPSKAIVPLSLLAPLFPVYSSPSANMRMTWPDRAHRASHVIRALPLQRIATSPDQKHEHKISRPHKRRA